MDFELSELQQMVVDSARRFVAAEFGLEQWQRRRGLADGVDPARWSQMVDLGWLAVLVPEAAGGLGGSMEDAALLMIELGRGLVVEPVVSNAILGVHLFAGQDDWLGRIATGACCVALAHLDPEQPGTRGLAARAADGGYVLSGEKFMAHDAPAADQLVVAASLDGQPALFIVPRDSVGLTLDSYALIDGSRAADLLFDDLRLPAGALLASGAEAAERLDRALDHARLALVAQAVGAIEAALEITADYAKQRQQFGQPIGKFQAIQHLAADSFVAAYQARSALYAGLRDIDAAPAARA
ncbi:MAG TPA: acyl-CoA dehydrogenase, partial [Novosphingobium sp.]